LLTSSYSPLYSFSPLILTMKDRGSLAPDDPRNPWAWVYQQLSGQKVSKPRRKAAKHFYADEIGDYLALQTNEVMNSDPNAKRVEVWQRLLGLNWKNLADDQKQYFQERSDSTLQKEMNEYEKLRKKSSSGAGDLEDIQKFGFCYFISPGIYSMKPIQLP
jgi:hypothetical protein